MTDKEYQQKKKECWEEFCKEKMLSTRSTVKGAYFGAFDRAYALGKQEKDADTVIQGWVARNRHNELYLYTEKPHRINCGIVFGEHTDAWSSGDLSFFPLDKELFPDITWESDPIEVEIIIKRKNNENNSKPSA